MTSGLTVSDTPRASKLEKMLALMQRPEGATLAQLVECTGWQNHSIRGAMSGALKRKRQIEISSEKTEIGRVYRVVSETAR